MKKFLPVMLTCLLFTLMAAGWKLPACAEEEGETSETEETVEAADEERTPLFRIFYECLGGDFKEDDYIPVYYYEGDEAITPPSPVKAGYTFGGWYTNKAYVRKVPAVNELTAARTGITTSEEGEAYIRIYAKWDPIHVDQPYISKLTNAVKGIITVFFNPNYGTGADGYELECASDVDFTRSVKTTDLSSIDTPALLLHKIEGHYYYIRVRAYVIDETGSRAYSDYCIPKTIGVTNGTTEVEPTANAATITSALIEGSEVVVTAEMDNLVYSYDDRYHIVEVDPIYGGVISDLASFDKDTEVTASFPVSGNLMARFALAVKTSDTDYTLISDPAYIDNPEALASISVHNNPGSVKGRQGKYETSAGDKNTFHNLYLETLIGTSSSYSVAYNYNGKTYYFYTPGSNYNELIKKANADGGTVSIQLMLRWNSNCTDLITPTGRTAGYNYYAFNMEESASREKIEALFMFLAEYWSKSGLHVDNWILGNEVNTYLNTTGRWYWAGNISHDAFMTNYSNTFRCLYYAVKSHNAAAQVFTCCDHTWNNRDNDWGTMPFMNALNSYLKGMNSNIQWNLAYHAYTAVLTNADPWNDGAVRLYSVAHSTGASFVTPYNLEVLTNYVANNFPSTRIILSEVGFSSTGGTNATLNGGRQSGTAVQAAATAYLYYKAQFSSNIDACIFHTGDEGEAGKNFSIEGKEAWNVYVHMDTPSYASYTNGYLGVIGGATSWESIIPGFSSAYLAGLPNR